MVVVVVVVVIVVSAVAAQLFGSTSENKSREITFSKEHKHENSRKVKYSLIIYRYLSSFPFHRSSMAFVTEMLQILTNVRLTGITRRCWN